MAFTVGSRDDNFERPPVGPTRALCLSVHDTGWKLGKFGLFQSCLILFEIEHRYQKEGDRKGKRHLVSIESAIGNTLRKKIESWQGKFKTDTEWEKFDLEALAGKGAILTLVENEANGKTYTNIDTIIPPMGEILTRETPEGYIPDWIKKKISEAKAKTQVKDWKPEDEGPNPAEEKIDPLEARRAKAKHDWEEVKASGAFSPDQLSLMSEELKAADQLPSKEWKLKGWMEIVRDWKEKNKTEADKLADEIF